MFESNPTWLAIRPFLDLKVYFEQAEMQAAAQPTDCSMRNLVMDVAFTVGQLPSNTHRSQNLSWLKLEFKVRISNSQAQIYWYTWIY